MESRRHISGGLAVLSATLVTAALSPWPALAAGSALTPSPETVQVGETISLSFTGFQPCSSDESLTVRWDKEPLPVNNVVAGPNDPASFTADAVVPSSPFGLNQIDAGCSTATEYFQREQGSVYVVALTPSVRMVQPGGTVTMTGSGFAQCTDPNESTTVELSANGTLLATATGSNGDFQQAITVPSGTPAGPYPVTAQCSAQRGSDLASASVYVVTLALSPSSGTPGTTISVTGGGYTQCHQVQLQLLRDATQPVATSSPFVPVNGSFTAEVTVPSGATPGKDYQVDAGCYPAAGGNAPIAIEQFTVTSPATSGSPAVSSTSASSPPSSTSSSPTQSGAGSASSPGSPSSSAATSSQSPGRTGGHWKPVALIGGTGAGLALVTLLLVRALSMVHGRQGRGWVNRHLRVVAGWAGPPSAAVERRPGAMSVSVGLEPHLDHLGNQQYEEVAR
jgi:large repetitive protein